LALRASGRRTSGDQVERGGYGFVGVAEGREPVDVWLAAEPGELALGEAARGLLDIRDSDGEWEAAFEMGAEVGVADELERLRVGGDAANIFTRFVTLLVTHLGRDEGADFVEPAGGEHFVHTGIDAGVESGTRRREADFGDGVAFESVAAHFATIVIRRVGAASAENLGDWLFGEDAHLDGADYFLGVAGGDAGGGGGVEAGQDFVQVRCAVQLGAAAETVAEFLGARGGVGEAFEEGAEVESCAGGEDGELRAAAQIVEGEEGVAAVVAGGEDFVGLDEVDEVMRDFLLVARKDLRGADVEMTIDLRRIANEDFAVETLCEFDGEGRFAGGGGAEDDDQARGRGGVHFNLVREFPAEQEDRESDGGED
jgi:hypothetical protein